jgi:hypothetical protein
MDTWGERDVDGAHAVRIKPHDGPAFGIPVHVEHQPKFDVIEGQNVENPAKLASFSSEDWAIYVPGRDPEAGDVMILPGPKRFGMLPTSVTTDGRFEVPLIEYVPPR